MLMPWCILRRCNSINSQHTQFLFSNIANNFFHYKPIYTEEEETKILNIINQENIEQLLKFDMTKGRIKNLQMWKMRNGQFRSVSEILEVEGMGNKILERFCNSIILKKTNENFKKNQGNRKQFVSPPIEKNVLNGIQSAVSIHSNLTGISWTKINKKDNEVENWNYQNFHCLPKKMLPSETYDLALRILQILPAADVYVMEAIPTIHNQNLQATKVLPAYYQHIEFVSMLVALINSSAKHGCASSLKDSDMQSEKHFISTNKVYFLKAYLPARLYKTMVGGERVSSGAITTKLLNGANDLPGTPVTTTDPIKTWFLSQSSVHKDLLGQALMLVVSFMDLCVYKNTKSLQIINNHRRNI